MISPQLFVKSKLVSYASQLISTSRAILSMNTESTANQVLHAQATLYFMYLLCVKTHYLGQIM